MERRRFRLRSQLIGYALAVLLVAASASLKWGVFGVVGNDRPLWVTLGPAVLVTWFRGPGPGLFAAALSVGAVPAVASLRHEASDVAFGVQEAIFAAENVGMVALVAAAVRWRNRSEQSARRLVDSYAFAAALGRAQTVQEVAEIALDEVVETFRVTAGVRLLMADSASGTLRSFAERANPWPAALGALYAVVPLDSESVVAVAGRTREAIFIENERQWKERLPGSYARFRKLASPGAIVALPMVVHDRLAGVLLIGFREARRFRPDDRTAWQVLARDCGKALERARLFESAQRERSGAQEASRAQDEFLSVSSSELRAPMSVIHGWTERLGQPQVERAWFDRGVCAIQQSVHALGNLIDGLLEMSRIVAGEFKVESRRHELSALVREGLATLRTEAIERGIELVLPGGPQEAQVIADGVRLQRAIRYFASSALRASPSGARVRVQTEVQGRRGIVRFRSEGRGAEPGGASGPDDDAQGGLAIATYIVEEHRGTVKVDRPQAGGFVASVELPLAGAMTGTMGGGAPAATVEGRSSPLAGSRLLVVADDADEGDKLAGILAELGAHVWQVHSVREALEELRVFAPEAIVSDLLSPDADPLGFIRDVRALSAPAATTPAIALTASPREADVREMLSAGYARNLTRPPEARALTEAIVELRTEVRSRGRPVADPAH
jgi:K+-sensing histidine kinase KdpD/CheY-like chemotaxis protein